MAMIDQKRKRLTSSATHFPNDSKEPAGSDSGASLANSQEAATDLLFDPKDAEGGNTHSDKPVKVKASVDDGEDLDLESVDDAMPEAVVEDSAESDDSELYSEAADEVAPSILDQADAEESDDLEEDEFVEADLEEDPESFGGDMGVDDPAYDEVEAEAELCGIDGVPLVDIDQTDDSIPDTEDLCFASIGANLHCIKNNRIIATMTKKAAIKAGKEDIYQGDEFPVVAASEIQTHGLRKGLITAGFELSKVSIDSNATVKAAVKKELSKTTQQLKASAANSNKEFQQCMAIAAVGLNRGFFKDASNPLKAHLEGELQASGMRGGKRLISAAFAQYGIEYAKALIAQANKLMALNPEVRDTFSDALDMTDSISDDDEEEEYIDEFDPDGDDDIDVPASVSAALSAPLRSTRVQASSTQKSTAREILAGTKPLPFI